MTSETVGQQEREIVALRDELGERLDELNRRRHEALDMKLQLRRHGLEVALTSVALVAATVGAVWFHTWREHRRQRLLPRLGRLREGVSRMIDRPERVAAEPTLGARILTAAATAAAAALVRKGLDRITQRIQDRHADVVAMDRWRVKRTPPAKVA